MFNKMRRVETGHALRTSLKSGGMDHYPSLSSSRVWRKGNPPTLLVGMLIGTTTMENSMEVP